MPQTILSPVSKPKFFDSAQKARDLLVAAGFAETVLYGFTSEESLKPFKAVAGEPIRISNPLSGDQSVMRTSLLPGLLDVMKLNISRQRCDLRVFSLQGVYHRQKSAGPILEPSYLAIAMTGHRYSSGWDRASEMLDFYDIKGAVDALFSSMRIKNETVYQRGDSHGFLHPGRFASIIVSGRLAGFVGMLHPDVAGSWNIDQEVFVAELDFELISKISFGGVTKFSELSKFPFVDRDLSLVVPERVPAVLLEKAISDSNVGILDEVRIFDVYRGGGVQDEHKSIAVSIRFADNQRTLTDEEVDKAQLKILNILQTRLGATLRT
jgi:phenylalanyl-tRNA synthetase beta chain